MRILLFPCRATSDKPPHFILAFTLLATTIKLSTRIYLFTQIGESTATLDLQAIPQSFASGARKWNHYRIQVEGQHYQIWLNGEKVNDFTGDRSAAGMVGLQNHDDGSQVSFRNIRIRPLGGAPDV